MDKALRLRCAGEAAIIAYLGDRGSPIVSARIQALAEALEARLGSILVDLIPSYASLLVIFDPQESDHYHVSAAVRDSFAGLDDISASTGELVEIPVYYSTESGDDLEALAERASLSTDEVIAMHSGDEYRVYAIGFAPGFAYLGDVDERIAAPRLSTPRQRVPRGAVGIADRQTAIYPAASPGGWNLIGRSPMRMFDADTSPPMPVGVGSRVRFVPITRDEFLRLGGEL